MVFPRKALLIGGLAGGLGLLASSSFASGDDSKARSPSRVWSSRQGALGGPTIGPEWFKGRQTIVYLLPQGADISSIRTAASQLMQEEWLAGKHGIKHIFISNVSGRLRFAARQRIAVHDIAEQVTIQAGQDLEFASDNLPFVREQVFFIWDPQAELWNELLGPNAADDPRLTILLLNQQGQVVETIDPATLDPEPELGQLSEFVTEVRQTFNADQ